MKQTFIEWVMNEWLNGITGSVLLVKMDKVLIGLMGKKQINKKTHPDFSYVYSDNISTFKNKEQMLQACTWKD